MPTFEFHCETCDRNFSEHLPMGTKTLPPCPKCKGDKVRKIIRPPMVVFKGSGFYKTDSGKRGSDSSPAPTKMDTPATTAKPTAEATPAKAPAPSTPPPATPNAKA